MNDNDSVAGPGTATDRRRHDIVVGIDDSAASAAALRWAAQQSRTTGAPLRLVHAWQMSAAASAAVAAGAGAYLEAATADARARATRWVLDTLGGEAAEVRWSLDVPEGSPGPVLVGRAHDGRLLVVGTHVHTGLRRAITGSVSHYVLTHADIPVVAVPPPAPERSAPSAGRTTVDTGPLF